MWNTVHMLLLHNGADLFFIPKSLQCFQFFSFFFKLYEISFQAIKSRLWPKQKANKKSKDEASKVEKMAKSQAPAPICAIPQITEAERQSPFERLIYDMAHNERIVNDLMLGKRVGFYELRGDIGQGNFSTVKLGIHALTKGLKLCGFITCM